MKLLATSPGDIRSEPKGFVLPTVSIIITNFNYFEYVHGALLSAATQTYPHTEILVVDDASTDGSWELICDLLATDARFASVKSLRLEKSSGQTGAAAAGFRASSGSYVVFLDADDVLMPRCVETHVFTHLSSRLAVGFSSVDCLIILDDKILAGRGSADTADFISSGKGRLTGMVRPIDQAADGLWISGLDAPIAPDDVHYVLPPQCEPWVWSYMSGHCFRRDALKLFLRGPLDGLKTGTDGFLVKPISALCGSMVIDKPLMGYRVHDKNAFTLSTPLLQMQSFGPTQLSRMVEVDKRSIGQMLDHAEQFASSCESADCFFQAIEKLCASWPLNTIYGETGYLQQMQKDHEAGLVQSFGRALFDDWVRTTEAAASENSASRTSLFPTVRSLGERVRARFVH